MRATSPVPHKRAPIEIIPLIDIMFFLPASFMITAFVSEDKIRNVINAQLGSLFPA
jgi:biopolymer transport protein ExbD